MRNTALGGCKTGDAKLTAGHRLRARHVVHAVGPVWRGGGANEAALLASCYRRALELAASVGARSIAFPCISTGVYGYPIEAAAIVAVQSLEREKPSSIDEVIFCCFSDADLAVYRDLLDGRSP